MSRYLTVCGCGYRFPPKQIAACCPKCQVVVAKDTPEGLTAAVLLTPNAIQRHLLLARAAQS